MRGRQEIRFARRRSLLDNLGLEPELAERLGVKTDGRPAAPAAPRCAP
jgi:hypothetical protein